MAGMSPLFKARVDGKDPADRTVTLIGKPGCHLCEETRRLLGALLAQRAATPSSTKRMFCPSQAHSRSTIS